MKKIVTINFKTFLKRERPKLNLERYTKNITAYSLYINPLAFFDLNFILIGAGVILIAVLEKKLAENGLVFIASSISSILRIAFPVVAAASIIYLISQSTFLLM